MSTETEPFSPFVAAILTAQADLTAATTNALVASLTERAEAAEAELAAIRADVTALLTGRYVPNPNAIHEALYPSPERVAAFRRAEVSCPSCGGLVDGLLAGCARADCRRREIAEDAAFERLADQ